MDWQEFEDFARTHMSRFFRTELRKKSIGKIPKIFDLVSDENSIVGDAKFLTLVNGIKLPPAKLMEIAGHVWLLENSPAMRRFLVFGNQREVPEWWLKKYGTLAHSVEFYFLSNQGDLERLR